MLHTCFVFLTFCCFQTLFLSVCFCTSIYIHESFSVAHWWTMLPPFWWKRYWITESVKILFASVVQHEDSRPSSQTVARLSSGLARNGFYRSELQWNWALPSAKGNEPMLKGSADVKRTVAWWETLKAGVLWAAHISALMFDRCERLCRAGPSTWCDWAVLIGIVPWGRVRLAEVDRTWAASSRDYIRRLDNLKCHLWGRVLKRCHSAFKVDYRDV